MPPKGKVAGDNDFLFSLGKGTLFQDHSHLVEFADNSSNKTSWLQFKVNQPCSYPWDHDRMKQFILQHFEDKSDEDEWIDKDLGNSVDILEINFKITENIAKTGSKKAQHRLIAKAMKLSAAYTAGHEYAFVLVQKNLTSASTSSRGGSETDAPATLGAAVKTFKFVQDELFR